MTLENIRITTTVVISAPIPTMKITGFFIKATGFSLIKESFNACTRNFSGKQAAFISFFHIYYLEIIKT